MSIDGHGLRSAGGFLLGADGVLRDGQGRRFDAAARQWSVDAAAGTSAGLSAVAGPAGAPAARALTPREAVRWLQTGSGHPLRTPIGVIGPRDVSEAQMAIGREIGIGLAQMGLVVVCGGRHGIMQAVAEGAHAAGGVSIGLLPDASPELANPFLTHVIATGLGEARNAIIARSAHLLIAIGDSFGTLSEVALGRHFGKVVLGLAGAARVDGVEHLATVDAALARVAEEILGGAPAG